MRHSTLLVALAIAAGAICAAGPVSAAQTLRIRDGDTTVVRISLRDQTRLRVASGRISEVVGDVYDADRNPGGRLVVLRDEAAGEVYLMPAPATADASPRPIKLDVKTDRGTVALLAQPADVIGETLTLQISGQVRAAEAEPQGRSSNYLRTVKAMVLALANPDQRSDLGSSFVPVKREVQLWQEARFVLVGRLETASQLGEVYELTNVSSTPMVVDERELFTAGVQGIVVERLQLPPGGTTRVLIVRELPRER